ncbi:MAG: tetratricopeptide repeat protein, partial [Fimbriimonadaceae bacterium]
MCPRCFAVLGPYDSTCPECGAPIDNGGNPVMDEDAVQPDLARANLLRMRGEYKQAEEVCLAILRRFPNQPTANGLLGDICAERGDLEQAAEWYELTLDLTPNDAVIERKLRDVRERMANRDVAETAKKLGLPTSKPRIGLFAIGLLIVLVGSAAVAYTLGRQAQPSSLEPDRTVVTDLPVTLSGDSRTEAGGATVGAAEDQAIVRKLLEAAPQESAKLLDAEIDPRTAVVTLTFRVSDGEDPRALGARLAAFTLQSEPRSPRVVLRAVRASALVWVADMD